jgi:hypothetical protein
MSEDVPRYAPPIPPITFRYDGSDYVPGTDNVRLDSQLGRVWKAMVTGYWLTLDELHERTGDPHASISAQLRHLRKPRFGAYVIEKRRRGKPEGGLWEYRMSLPSPSQPELF